MARPKKLAPGYRYHVSGQAVVTFNGKNFFLGEHDSPESHARYRKLVAEYIASGFQTPEQETHQGETKITVADVTAEARPWLRKKYRSEYAERTRMLRLCDTLDEEYGKVEADKFGPRKLEALRDLFVTGGNCRKYANRQTGNVIRIFRYALSRELIDPMTIVRLESLESLRPGQTEAKESEPVQPANIEHVRATAKHLSPPIRAMVRIQAATGMRPSEVCRMRPMDVDRSGEVWVYRPPKHKTANRGKTKAVPIIGDAQDALTPFLERDEDKPCFSPKESAAWHRAKRRLARTTPDSCGNRPGTNVKENPKKQPGEEFNAMGYRQAIQRAAEKAKVPHWFPYQLRHLAATVVRDALGVEAAQALMGHSQVSMTEHYAKLSEAKAIEAAKAAPSL